VQPAAAGRPAWSRGALAGLRSGGEAGVRQESVAAVEEGCASRPTRLSCGVTGNPDAQQEGHSRGSGYSLPPASRSFFSVLAPWQLTGMAPALIWQARKGRHGRMCPHQRAIARRDGGERAARPESSRLVEEQGVHDQNRWGTSCVASSNSLAREELLLA
jgi:hypothetical protein